MNTQYFTKDNLRKVLDNEIYNILKANEDGALFFNANVIYDILYTFKPIFMHDLEFSISRLLSNNCIVFDKNVGYKTTNIQPESCIEYY